MALKINKQLKNGVTATYTRIRKIGIDYGKENMTVTAEFSLYLSEKAYKENNNQELPEYPNLSFELAKDFEGNLPSICYEKAKKSLFNGAVDLLEEEDKSEQE